MIQPTPSLSNKWLLPSLDRLDAFTNIASLPRTKAAQHECHWPIQLVKLYHPLTNWGPPFYSVFQE